MDSLSEKLISRLVKELFRIVLERAPDRHGEISWSVVERATGEQVCAGECTRVGRRSGYREAYREAIVAATAILARREEVEAQEVSPDDDSFHRPVALLDPSGDRDDYLCAEGAHFL